MCTHTEEGLQSSTIMRDTYPCSRFSGCGVATVPTLNKENITPTSYLCCPIPIYPPKLVLCWYSMSDTRNDIKSLSLFTDINVHILQHLHIGPNGGAIQRR